MPRRSNHKNQQKEVKKASDAIATEKDFGNDLAERKHNELKKS